MHVVWKEEGEGNRNKGGKWSCLDRKVRPIFPEIILKPCVYEYKLD